MYKEIKFNIPELKGISIKTIEEHIKLYSGYVTNANNILDKINEYSKDSEKNTHAISELNRRFSFEYNGIRNHEYYFRLLENGPSQPSKESTLYKQIEKQWDSFDEWRKKFSSLAMTRGIGWAVMYYDKISDELVLGWVDEQHLGHLNSAQFIFGIDMWEHAFILDYPPRDKKKYVEAFFDNINWSVAEQNYNLASSNPQ